MSKIPDFSTLKLEVPTSSSTPEAAKTATWRTVEQIDVNTVYPEAEHTAKSATKSGELLEKWQTSRALGELSGIPRGRKGVGIGLTGARTAQAWARKHRQLREALTRVVEERDAR